MTKNEIKLALDLAGVVYAKKANLETLEALYAALPQEAGSTDTTSIQALVEATGNTLGTNLQDTTNLALPMGENGNTLVDPEEPVAPATEATGTGLKIEKDRPMQNGIKRPSAGGRCRAVWDALDAYRAETGELPTSKTVKELAADEGWNPNNASIEFYQWRKFNGIAKA